MPRIRLDPLRRATTERWAGSWHNIAALLVTGIATMSAAEAQTSGAWTAALTAIGGMSLVAWVANHRRYRLIRDTPRSAIASAAQGFVELSGWVKPLGAPLASLLSQSPCLWYRCITWKRNSKSEWVVERDETSTAPFLLDDGSGICVIDPVGAEVTTATRKSWQDAARKHVEFLIAPEEWLYALGEFVSYPDSSRHPHGRATLNALLSEWKRDPAALRARYDRNRDGEVDLQEWEAARADAQTEVAARLGARTAHDGLHVLRRPGDGRPFILSTVADVERGTVYRVWMGVQLILFLLACAGFAWVR